MSRRGSAAALPLWLATLLLVSMAVDPARSMLMQPADPRTSNWDTWLLLNDSHVNYFYLKGTNCTPHCLNYLHGWDGIGLATAPLGTVQFTDRGEVLHMDPPAPDLHWLGSGSVYLAPNRAAVGGARYIMTYSQGPGAGTRPTTAAASQKIYFATSNDLTSWTKSNVSFETDTSLYTVQTGAWDCIATLPAADGSLFGYFFAKAKQTLPGAHGGGGGFAHSTDGIHWRALSPVAGSASSVFRFGPRIWLTDMTLSGPATSPSGPFKSSVVNDRGHLVNMGFVRAWTINSSLVLLTHQHIDDRINGASSYLGVIKQVRDDPDLVPRAFWWPQNNGLRGAQLTLRPQQQQRQDSDPIYQHSGGSTQLVEIEKFDAQVGIVLEVHGGTGVLVETVPVGNASSGLNPPRSLTALMFVDNCFKVASVVSLEPVLNLSKPESICRGLPLDAPLNFRVLLRNHRSRVAEGATADANACLGEYYANELLGHVFTWASHATGRVGAIGGGTVRAYAALLS